MECIFTCKKVSIVFFVSLLMCASASANTDHLSFEKELNKCALITGSSKRLVCFDLLVKRSSEIIAAEEKKKTVSAANKHESLTEDIGGARFRDSRKEDQGRRGLVTRCQKSYDDRIFFIFDNGQIWKQVKPSPRDRKLKDCNFNVTIRKDSFGYRLQKEGEKWSTRVIRHK